MEETSEKMFTLPSGGRALISAKRAFDKSIKVSSLTSLKPSKQDCLGFIELWVMPDSRIISSCFELNSGSGTEAVTLDDKLAIDAIIDSDEFLPLVNFATDACASAQSESSVLLNVHMPMYSSLEREVANVNMKKAEVKQWLGWMKNLAGVSKTEKISSGLQQFLLNEPQSKMMRKEEIIDHICLAQVTPSVYRLVDNTMKSRTIMRKSNVTLPGYVIRALPNAWCYSAHVILVHPSFNYRIIEVKFSDLFGFYHFWLVYDEKWSPIIENHKQASSSSLTEAIGIVHNLVESRYSRTAVYTDAPKWEEYKLPGGEESQDWLLSLDNIPPVFCFEEHYDVQNLLLHIRSSIRRTVDGKKIFFIEELQSDWMQKYDSHSHEVFTELGREMVIPWKKNWYELGIKVCMCLAVQQECVGVGWTPGSVHVDRYGSCFGESGVNFYDSIVKKYMTKLSKQWETKVSDIKLRIDDSEAVIVADESGYQILNKNGFKVGVKMSSLENAKKEVSNITKVTSKTVPVFELVSSLKNHLIKNGMPLFGCNTGV